MTRARLLSLIAAIASAGVLVSLSLQPEVAPPARVNDTSTDQLLTDEVVLNGGDEAGINVAHVTVASNLTPLVLAPGDVAYG